jgi:DUF1680 family protein
MLTRLALGSISLGPGPILDRRNRNRAYLASLDPHRLLHSFRLQAGLPSHALPLGGWEAPDHGLRGHFVGHYLSACSYLAADADDPILRDRALCVVEGLGECQQAIGTGYIGAFPKAYLSRIETSFEGEWASYYVVQKILQGLVDASQYLRDELALSLAVALADYVIERFQRLSAEQIGGILRTTGPNPTNETGAWAVSLRQLFRATGYGRYAEFAETFDCQWFLEPLWQGIDELDGLHCNTHIPIVLGAIERYRIGGEERYLTAAKRFWEMTAMGRSYANGGSSGPRPDGREKSVGGEHWPRFGDLSGTLTPKINESCVTHNMLKLTADLFGVTGDTAYMEFYERAYYNSVMCMQGRSSEGRYLYDHPLGADSRKVFGDPLDSFWCCYGSTVEAYTRLTEHIAHSRTDSVALSLYIPSTIHIAHLGVTLNIEAEVPLTESVKVRVLEVGRTPIALEFRIPAWVDSHGQIRVNGGKWSSQTPGSYAVLRNAWRAGDEIELRLPMSERELLLPGSDAISARFRGPTLLAMDSERNRWKPLMDVDEESYTVYGPIS